MPAKVVDRGISTQHYIIEKSHAKPTLLISEHYGGAFSWAARLFCSSLPLARGSIICAATRIGNDFSERNISERVTARSQVDRRCHADARHRTTGDGIVSD